MPPFLIVIIIGVQNLIKAHKSKISTASFTCFCLCLLAVFFVPFMSRSGSKETENCCIAQGYIIKHSIANDVGGSMNGSQSSECHHLAALSLLACVHSRFKRHVPWAIMCCPLLYLEPHSQHMDANWVLTTAVSVPARGWPSQPVPLEMFVPVAPDSHAGL